MFLVTGGCGFLGSHLVDALVARDEYVLVVDDMSSPALAYREGMWGERVRVVEARVQDWARTANEELAGIYHLAAAVGPAGVLPHAGEMVRDTTEATYAAIELAQMNQCRLVDVSTSEVYGGDGSCDETHAKVFRDPTARGEYAVAKLAMEWAISNKVAQETLDAVLIRPFNIAGPRQQARGGFVLPRFCEQALTGKPLTVFGDGRQLRAFTHVRDIVSGLLHAMEFGRSGEVYDLCNIACLSTIRELAELVIEVTNSKSEIVYVDPTTIYGPYYAEVGDKFSSALKARQELRWQPQRDLRKIVEDTVRYHALQKRDPGT